MTQAKNKILIRQIRKGDSAAFAEVYDRYADNIYRFVYFKVSSRQDAEDLASQVFVRALEYCLNEEKRVGNLQALLYSIARNLVIDFYRRKSRQEIPLEEKIEDGTSSVRTPWASGGWEGDLEEKIRANSQLEETKKAIGRIREEYGEIIVMHYIDELSAKEIAKILGKSNGAVRVLIHRALAALKAVIGEDQSL